MPNQDQARQAAEAMLAEARAELERRKQVRLQRAYRRLGRWESPLMPALASALATWALTAAANGPLISITFGVTAGYLYGWLGRRSAEEAVGRLERNQAR